MSKKITVIGGGAMATACAMLLNEHDDQQVSIWMRNSEYADQVARSRENKRLLPGVHIPKQIEITSQIERAVDQADFLVMAVPSAYLRNTHGKASSFTNPRSPLH